MPRSMPLELHCEMFKFLPIQKAIQMLKISKVICALNKEEVKRKWEKTKPLTAEEKKKLIGLIKTKCRTDRRKMMKVIQLIEQNEQLAHIRIFFRDYSIKIVGQREHPVTKEPRQIISYHLKPTTGRILFAYFDSLAE